jgi:predicted phage tail protein
MLKPLTPIVLPPSFNGSSRSCMTRVRLYGKLGREFGKEHVVNVATVGEVVRAIECRRPGFKSRILSMKSHDFAVKVGKRYISEGELPLMTHGKTITITPVAQGSASTKGILQIVAGVVLVAAGLVLGPEFTALGGYLTASTLVTLGVGLALGGIASLLAPSPTTPGAEGKSKASYLFSSAQNVSVQGAAVPLAYGRVFCGSVLSSVAIVNADVKRGSQRSGRNTNPAVGGGGGTDGNLSGTNSGRVIGGPGGLQPYAMTPQEMDRMFTGQNIAGARSNVGGAGGEDTPSGGHEDPDTLQSRGRGRMEHIICEGPIRGLVGEVEHGAGQGDRSIYFNDTPIRNSDGTLNFGTFHDPDEPDEDKQTKSTMEWFFANGTQNQGYMPGFDEEVNVFPDGVQLKYGSTSDSAPPDDAQRKLFSFSNPDLDAVRFDIRVPRLEKVKRSGDIVGSQVTLKFEVNTNGGGWVEVIHDTIDGKCSGPYVRSYKIELPSKPGPWQVRVTRLTPDSAKARHSNETYIDAHSEIIYVKLRHPNTVKAGLLFDAAQFSTIPNVTFYIYGMLVKIPTNYDPDARTYAGSWDGTFKTGWTSNPVWVLWDIITQNRYGLGNYVNPALLDKWEFFRCAQYCDGRVPDGFGGQELRYDCNVYIAGREDAIKVIRDVASIFRASVAYLNGLLVPIQDRPVPEAEFSFQFSPDNVEDGEFDFSNVSRKQARTVALVSWNDPRDFGRRKVEYVEDLEQVLRYGVREATITAMGCYSRGQAHRMGKWLLFTEKLRAELLALRTGLEGATYRPGDVGRVQVPFRSGKVLSGRISSATTTSVTLDKEVTIQAGFAYQLNLFKSDGTIVAANVGNAPSTTNVLTLTVALASAPVPQTVWMLEEGSLVPELFRILSLRMTDKLKTEISLLTYNESIYDAVELDHKIEEPDVSDLPSLGQCAPPANVVCVVRAELDATLGPRRVIHVSWDASNDKFLRDYMVAWHRLPDQWKNLPATTLSFVEVPVTLPGPYEFKVIARNTLGIQSQPAYGSIDVDDGNPFDDPQVSGLELHDGGNTAQFPTQDALFTWRINSRAVSPADLWWDDPLPSTQFDPLFESFEVRVIRPSDKRVIFKDETKIPLYNFTLDKNVKANGGGAPLAAFIFEVRVKDRYHHLSKPERMMVNKTAPTEVPTQVTALGGLGAVTLNWKIPTDPFITNMLVWAWAGFGAEVYKNVGAFNARAPNKTLAGLPNDRQLFFKVNFQDNFGQQGPMAITSPSFLFVSAPPNTAILSARPKWVPNGGQATSAGQWFIFIYDYESLPNVVVDYHYRYDTTPVSIGDLYTRSGQGFSKVGGGSVSVAAAVNGILGPSETRTFYLTSPPTLAQPFLFPIGGTHWTETGYMLIKIDSGVTFAVWYFWTLDGSDPTFNSATNPPTPLGTTKRETAAGSFLRVLPPGVTRIRMIVWRSVNVKSDITNEVYSVGKSGVPDLLPVNTPQAAHPTPAEGGVLISVSN